MRLKNEKTFLRSRMLSSISAIAQQSNKRPSEILGLEGDLRCLLWDTMIMGAIADEQAPPGSGRGSVKGRNRAKARRLGIDTRPKHDWRPKDV